MHDVDEAIVVAESLNDFRGDAAKGRDNRSKTIPPKSTTATGAGADQIPAGAVTREATLVTSLPTSRKIMRTARGVLLIGKVVTSVGIRPTLLGTVHH